MGKKVAQVIVKGNSEHNLPFLIAIGQLIVSWSNNESLFPCHSSTSLA
jgi:hypothetical protein